MVRTSWYGAVIVFLLVLLLDRLVICSLGLFLLTGRQRMACLRISVVAVGDCGVVVGSSGGFCAAYGCVVV